MKKIFYIFLFPALLFAEKPFTDNAISKQEMEIAIGESKIFIANKENYAIVNRDWLEKFHAKHKKEYFKYIGDETFLCTNFTAKFISDVSEEFSKDSFYSWIRKKATGIAVGEKWYITDIGTFHALVIVFTENGLEFFEPQTGKFVDLTESEKTSSYLIKFN